MKIGLGIGVTQPQNAPLASMQNPSSLFLQGEQGAWYDPSDINLTWRRNLLTYSEQFDNAAWFKNNWSSSANASTAPDGTLSADKMVENTTNGFHATYYTTSLGTVTGTYSYSVYLKAAGRSWVNVRFNNVSTWFDVSNGVTGTVGSGVSASILNAGNGWYRCIVSASISSVAISPELIIATGDLGGVYTGDGTSGIYIWGAQLELGNTATAYQRITDGIKDYLDYKPLPVLYQDAAGTTPCTAVEQPVGLMLDKSKGLVLGPELLPNGDFATSSGWTTTNGVTIANGEAVFSSVTSGSSLYAAANLATTPGVWYQLQFTIKSRIAGSIGLRLASIGGGTPRSYSDPGTYVYRLAVGTASPSNTYVVFDAIGFSGVVDDVSVKAIPGNHAFNPSGNSANFPVLQQDGTGRYYLAFNGVNQWLQTNSIDFTYGDKMFVCAGVRKLSDAAVGVVAELSASILSNNGTFGLFAPASVSTNMQFASKGTTINSLTVDSVAAPITAILTGQSNIAAPKLAFSVNTVAATPSTSTQGAGNYGNYPLYIGARAGSSLWFNGRLYGLLLRGAQTGITNIQLTERYMNTKTAAYLEAPSGSVDFLVTNTGDYLVTSEQDYLYAID